MLNIDREAHPASRFPAAAAAGLLTDAPIGVRTDAAGGRIELERLEPRDTSGCELVYAVLPVVDPEAEDIRDAFRASAIAVDVVFEDGSRLLDDPGLRDQHGLPAGAGDSFTHHALWSEQWNLRRIALDGRRAVSLELVAAPPEGHGPTGAFLDSWLDGIRIEPARRLDRSLGPAELVDTRRGTHSSRRLSRGNTAPFTAVPHGAVFATPMTKLTVHNSFSWNLDGPGPRSRLAALALSHSASVWIGDWGVLHLAPLGDDAAREYAHADERARPHHYRVVLADGTRLEATASDHCTLFRVAFPADAPRALRVGALGTFSLELRDGNLLGWIDGDSLHGNVVPRVFVHAAADTPLKSLVDGLLSFADGDEPVTLAVGTSLIGHEVAASTLTRETAGGFDAVAAEARQRWDEVLGGVHVEGASDDQLATLYGSLYRIRLYPNRVAETLPDGTLAHAVPDSPAGPHSEERTGATVAPGPLSSNHGFWDTYRTAWSALFLLDPATATELFDGFVQHARDSGWVPRWSAPGAIDAMVGTSFDVVVGTAAAAGVPEELLEEAYLAALRDATALPPDRTVGRKGQTGSLLRGYLDRSTPEGLSWTLEGAVCDDALARVARLLAERDASGSRAAEARYLASRALAFQTLFDPETGFFRGREADGRFGEDFDPAVWGGDYTETNAWGMAFSAPHAGDALAHLHGGRDGLRDRLDRFFVEPETARDEFRGEYPIVIHEMTEARDMRFGMWAPSNQPAHHIPFMYAHAGDPSAMQRIVREALGRLFTGSEIGQGYPGDEDNGELSAWWLFAALGVYPLSPGAGEYVLCSPLFPRASIELEAGHRLEIVAHGHAPDRPYVAGVRVDGEPWPHLAIDHARLAAGALIEFEMSAEPTEWGTMPDTASASPRLADAAVRSSEPALVDDRAESAIVVEVIEVDLDAPAVPELYTLLFEEPGTASWHLEFWDETDGWALADARVEEPVSWPGQLRPFALATPAASVRWRLTADGPLRLRQIELLVPQNDR